MLIAIVAFLLDIATVLTAVYVGWGDSTGKKAATACLAIPPVLFFSILTGGALLPRLLWKYEFLNELASRVLNN